MTDNKHFHLFPSHVPSIECENANEKEPKITNPKNDS